jgi:hypothetical protein
MYSYYILLGSFAGWNSIPSVSNRYPPSLRFPYACSKQTGFSWSRFEEAVKSHQQVASLHQLGLNATDRATISHSSTLFYTYHARLNPEILFGLSCLRQHSNSVVQRGLLVENTEHVQKTRVAINKAREKFRISLTTCGPRTVRGVIILLVEY